MTRILIVDDHPVFRRGLAFLLSSSGYEIAGEATSGAEAIEAIRERSPDVVLLDLGLPELHGSAVASRVRAELPGIRIVVVTMHDDEASISRALEAGVDAYVLKDAPPEQILAAVEAVASGARLLGSGVALPRTSPAAGGDALPSPSTLIAPLTARERAVAVLLREGLTNRTIAARLGVADKTVANYVASIRFKLGASSRYEAARLLREE